MESLLSLIAFGIQKGYEKLSRICEAATVLTGKSPSKDAFLMGLFFFLDALIDRPLEELSVAVGLAPPTVAALLETAPEGNTLTTVYQQHPQ